MVSGFVVVCGSFPVCACFCACVCGLGLWFLVYKILIFGFGSLTVCGCLWLLYLFGGWNFFEGWIRLDLVGFVCMFSCAVCLDYA